MENRCNNCGSIHLLKKGKSLECLSCGEKSENKANKSKDKLYSCEEIYKLNVNSIVCLRMFENEKYIAYGTGYVVNGYILTNFHVINNKQKGDKSIYENIVAIDSNKNAEMIDYVYHNDLLDIAILKLREDSSIKGNFILKDTQINVGEEVIAIGNALDKGLTINKGIVGGINVKIKNANRFIIDNAIARGNSGGPIINLKNNLVGMVVEGEKDNSIKYAIHIKDILEFIKNVERMEGIKILDD